MGAVDDMSDVELVRLTLQGRSDCYRPLVARYQGHVYGLAYSLVGNWADAQDIAQETFIRAYSNLDQLRDPSRFAGWLRRVTFGVAMDWVRTFRPKLFAQFDGKVDLEKLEIPDFAPGPAEVAERRELADAVLRAVAGLPPKYRVPLTMFHLDGLSYQKVADFLDIPLGTAKSIIHRAQEKLKAAMGAALIEKETMDMVQDVFNEHKLASGFASRVVERVGRLQFGHSVDNQLIAVLSVILRTQGKQVTYDQVMGVSGAAFRVHFWEADWCPSSVNLFGGFDHAVPALHAVGFTGQRYSCSSKDVEGVAALRNAVVTSIDHGIPVIGESLEGRGRLAVIAGYTEEGKTFLCRLWDQTADELIEVKRWPWSVYVLKPEGREPAWAESVQNSLRLCVELATTPSYVRDGRQASGFAAYEKWIEFLTNRASSPAADPDRIQYETHANAVIYHCLVDARGAASRYLRESAPYLPLSARDHVLRAADDYGAVFHILQAHQSQIPAPWTPATAAMPWSADCRRAQVDVLRSALDREKNAVAEVTAGLERAGARMS